MTMNEFTEERQEEAIIGIGPISQPKVKGFFDPSSGGDKESDKHKTQSALMLEIYHDHDGDETTEVEPVDEPIAVNVVDGYTYQLEAGGSGSDNVFWSSATSNIATVDEKTGLVKFTGEEGEAVIHLYPNDNSGEIADSVTFIVTAGTPMNATQPSEGSQGKEIEGTTAPTATQEPMETITEVTMEPVPMGEETQPGLLEGKGLLLAIIGGLLVLSALAALLARSASRKKKKARRPRPQMHLDQDGEHTAVQSGPVRTDLTVPAEDAVSAVQPMNGIRAGVYQALGARKDQQDSYGMTDPALYAQQGVLALVADGMGGLANGKAVSSALVNTFLGEYRNLVDREQPQDILVKLSISANQRINQMLMGADRSGSTLVSVMIREGLLYFLTVGDSRIYLYRGGALLQLNREHIYQEELVVKAANCQVPLSQVTGDRQAHALTSFFGSGSITYLDRNYEGIRLVPGDRLMLCSDGVFGTLSQAQMERAMEYDVRTAAETLKNMVLDAGKPHQDNNTCVILEYLG